MNFERIKNLEFQELLFGVVRVGEGQQNKLGLLADNSVWYNLCTDHMNHCFI